MGYLAHAAVIYLTNLRSMGGRCALGFRIALTLLAALGVVLAAVAVLMLGGGG